MQWDVGKTLYRLNLHEKCNLFIPSMFLKCAWSNFSLRPQCHLMTHLVPSSGNPFSPATSFFSNALPWHPSSAMYIFHSPEKLQRHCRSSSMSLSPDPNVPLFYFIYMYIFYFFSKPPYDVRAGNVIFITLLV